MNKKVGQGLASAIETGEKATEVTKEKAAHASNVAGAKAGEVRLSFRFFATFAYLLLFRPRKRPLKPLKLRAKRQTRCV